MLQPELKLRRDKIRALMAQQGIDAALITCNVNLIYTYGCVVSGYLYLPLNAPARLFIKQAAKRYFLLEYWRTNDFMVDYLFLDYLIVLVQRHCTAVKEAFAAITPNNPQCDDLFKCLGDVFNERHWESLIADTSLFKLTWKQEFPTEINGVETYYGRLLNGNLRRN